MSVFQANKAPFGKVRYTHWQLYSQPNTQPNLPNVSSTVAFGIPISILLALCVSVYWTKKRTGDQPLRWSRFFWESKSCLTHRISTLLLRQMPSTHTKRIELCTNQRSESKPKSIPNKAYQLPLIYIPWQLYLELDSFIWSISYKNKFK